ncbi:MAG: glutaredoxin domain-containing protein [Bacillota bacterium]
MLELYVKDGCPYCEKQVKALKEEGKDYKLYNVSSDPEALKKAKNEFKASKVPILAEDGEVKSEGFGGGG